MLMYKIESKSVAREKFILELRLLFANGLEAKKKNKNMSNKILLIPLYNTVNISLICYKCVISSTILWQSSRAIYNIMSSSPLETGIALFSLFRDREQRDRGRRAPNAVQTTRPLRPVNSTTLPPSRPRRFIALIL